MNINKSIFLDKICYTELVYGRINKKLSTQLSKEQIEALICKVITESENKAFNKIGKNYYITNFERAIKITVNSNTFRVITVDRIKQKPLKI